MKCDEKIFQCYEEIIACQAQDILDRIEKNVCVSCKNVNETAAR